VIVIDNSPTSTNQLEYIAKFSGLEREKLKSRLQSTKPLKDEKKLSAVVKQKLSKISNDLYEKSPPDTVKKTGETGLKQARVNYFMQQLNGIFECVEFQVALSEMKTYDEFIYSIVTLFYKYMNRFANNVVKKEEPHAALNPPPAEKKTKTLAAKEKTMKPVVPIERALGNVVVLFLSLLIIS
jgi:hypothetical protein